MLLKSKNKVHNQIYRVLVIQILKMIAEIVVLYNQEIPQLLQDNEKNLPVQIRKCQHI